MGLATDILQARLTGKRAGIPEEDTQAAIEYMIESTLDSLAKSMLQSGEDIYRAIKIELINAKHGLSDKALRRMVAKAEADARESFYSLGGAMNPLQLEKQQDIRYRLAEFEDMIKGWGPDAVTFGIRDLDESAGGIYPGEICVVNGAPGGMKTSLALSMVENFILRKMGKVLFISVDMSPEDIFFRLMLRETGNVYSERQLRALLVSDHDDYKQAKTVMLEKYSEDFICEGHMPRQRIDLTKFEYLIGKHMPDLVVLDYLTSLESNGVDEFKFVNAAMIKIHELAQELKIPFVILSQMSRASRQAQAGGQIGGLARGGGKVEELATIEIQLSKEDAEDGGKPEIYATVAKTRRGIAGKTFRLDYNGNSMRFTGLADEAEKMSKKKRIFAPKGMTF